MFTKKPEAENTTPPVAAAGAGATATATAVEEDMGDAILQALSAAGASEGYDAQGRKIKSTVPTLSQYPVEMSCYRAFEELIGCYSIGGQFRHAWRYGGLGMCEEKQDRWMFCIKQSFSSEADKARKVQNWYKQKLARDMATKGSSESIWSSRSEPLNKPFLESWSMDGRTEDSAKPRSDKYV